MVLNHANIWVLIHLMIVPMPGYTSPGFTVLSADYDGHVVAGQITKTFNSGGLKGGGVLQQRSYH